MNKIKTQKNREICRKLRTDGDSIRLISEKTKLSYTAIRYHIKGINVKTKNFRGGRSGKNGNGGDRLLFDGRVFPHSDDLAYLYGIYLGDGCVSGNKFVLSCGTKHHPYLVQKWSSAMTAVTGKIPKLRHRKQCRCTDIYIYDKFISKRMNVEGGRKTFDCFIPDWILNNIEYSKKCLLGLMESDGGIYHVYKKGGWYWQSQFTSSSSNLIKDIIKIFEMLGIETKTYRGRNGANNIKIGSDGTKKIIDVIGIDKKLEYVY